MPPELPIKLDIEPGDQTSEGSAASLMQWVGGGGLGGVLTLAVVKPEIPPSIIITALICTAAMAVIPTLHYIASRRAIKCDRLRAEAEIHKQQIAKQAAPPRRDIEAAT